MGATMTPVGDILRRTPGFPVESDSNKAPSEGRQPFRLLEMDTVIDGQAWPAEMNEPKVSDRLNAQKSIEVELLDASQGAGVQLAAWANHKANHTPGAAIGLVLNTVAEARHCAEALRKNGVSPARIVTLTGSMRGWDRDAIVESDEYARFKSQRDRSATSVDTAFLVATSCVEVGADVDCDHMGTEACAADSLIQRLGRVNRLGLRKQSVSVKIVGDLEEQGPEGQVFKRLRELTNGQTLDGAPATLPERLMDGLDGIRGLFGVRVPPPALTSAVLDDLAMTSKYPVAGARPDVARWLHGSVEEAALYIELAWRTELDWITDPEGAVRLLNAFPIAARETARCPLYEAVSVLDAIRARAIEDSALGSRVVLSIDRLQDQLLSVGVATSGWGCCGPLRSENEGRAHCSWKARCHRFKRVPSRQRTSSGPARSAHEGDRHCLRPGSSAKACCGTRGVVRQDIRGRGPRAIPTRTQALSE